MILSRRHMIFGLAATSLGFAHQTRAAGQITGGHAFGSTWRIVTSGAVDLPMIRTTVQAIIDHIDMEMSPYLATSDLSRFNTCQSTDRQNMPPSMCHVATKALAIADQTNGAFDPTVGPLVRRFGFGPIDGAVGRYTDISVNGITITKNAPHLTLDLCGIAKGYALDEIAASLTALGVMNAVVEVGGEIKTIGRHPDGRPWHIAIVDPLEPNFKARRIVTPKHNALATSGHTPNGVLGRTSTSHIINPDKGRPAFTNPASVSVLAASAMEADALATGLCAAGLVAGVSLARQRNIAALFIADGSTFPTEVMTGSFADHVLR